MGLFDKIKSVGKAGANVAVATAKGAANAASEAASKELQNQAAKPVKPAHVEGEKLYIIEDEEGNELGYALWENGQTVEYYYEEVEEGSEEAAEILAAEAAAAEAAAAETAAAAEAEAEKPSIVKSDIDEESEAIEFSEDDIAYYITDENDVEIGFALIEDGKEVEYYYTEEEIEATKNAPKEKSDLQAGFDATKEVVSEVAATAASAYKQGLSMVAEFAPMLNEFKGAIETGKKVRHPVRAIKDDIKKTIDEATAEPEAEAAEQAAEAVGAEAGAVAGAAPAQGAQAASEGIPVVDTTAAAPAQAAQAAPAAASSDATMAAAQAAAQAAQAAAAAAAAAVAATNAAGGAGAVPPVE